MKRLLKPDGKPVIIGKSLMIVKGVNEGKVCKVDKIIQPSADKPEGLLIVDRTGMTYQSYYPDVFGCYWDDIPPEAGAIATPVTAGPSENLSSAAA